MISKLIELDKAIASSFFVGKTLDAIYNYVKDNKNKRCFESIEHQIVEVLDETLEEFCNQNNLEFDNNAIISTYLYNVSQLNNFGTQSSLIKILEDATGMLFHKTEYNMWMILFKKNIAKPKYTWLFNIIMLNHIEEKQFGNFIEIYAKIEIVHDEIIIEDLDYLDYLCRNLCIVDKSFFINEDTICLMVPEKLEKILVLLTRNFNYNYQKDFKVRLYKIP